MLTNFIFHDKISSRLRLTGLFICLLKLFMSENGRLDEPDSVSEQREVEEKNNQTELPEKEKILRVRIREIVRETTKELVKDVESFIDKYDGMIHDTILKSKLNEALISFEDGGRIRKFALVTKFLYVTRFMQAIRDCGHDPENPQSYQDYLDGLAIINLKFSHDELIDVIRRVLIFDYKNPKDPELERSFFEGFKINKKDFFSVLDDSQEKVGHDQNDNSNTLISLIADEQFEDVQGLLEVDFEEEEESMADNPFFAEFQEEKPFILTKFDPDDPREREQLLELRNETIIRGVDVLRAMFVDKGLFTDDLSFGRSWLEKYGGLSPFISLEQLSSFFTEDIYIIKLCQEVTIGAYLTTTNLTVTDSSTKQELAALGKSCGQSLIQDLICRNKEEKNIRQKALHSLMESQLVLCSTLCASRHFRRNGIGTVLKAITFQKYLEKNINKALLRIFSINGIYKKEKKSSEKNTPYKQIHKFNPPIRNVGSFALNKRITQGMGFVPKYQKIIEMDDAACSANQIKEFMSTYMKISSKEMEDYYARIDYFYFFTDIAQALKCLNKEINEKNLSQKFLFNPLCQTI